MIALHDVVAVLLCAGRSRRFGPGNKLLAMVAGKTLVRHAAELCTQAGFAAMIAVVPQPAPDETDDLHALLSGLGFALVVNPDPDADKDASLRLGLSRADAFDAAAAMVLLGDMPHVDHAQLRALSQAADATTAAISREGTITSPPVLLPRVARQRVLAHPELPIRACLGQVHPVDASAGSLRDYDLRAHFDAA